jgi:hypothetical protein
MKNPFIKVQGLSVFWLLTFVTVGVHAQEISGITINETTSSPNTPVSVQVDFNLADVQNPYCGLEISFGDGDVQAVRAGLNGAQDFPVKLTHSYANPGKYLVKAEGKTLIRGFKSASACQGSIQQRPITIVDAAAENAKAELARRERALAARQIELQQLAKKMENEQAARAQQLREQELAQKQREIDQKERELEQKQRAIDQKERQAQNKYSKRDNQQSQIPVIPSPAPTPNRGGIDGF